uniref:Uncharacterized protein n=1 Tax=Romanomermis culicivorax TaxID=13658 RepID=A0A915JUM4_ROMCU
MTLWSHDQSKFRGCKFILDDESYFTFSHSNKNSNTGYWSSDVSNVSKAVKYKARAKFEKKLFMQNWIGPDSNGNILTIYLWDSDSKPNKRANAIMDIFTESSDSEDDFVEENNLNNENFVLELILIYNLKKFYATEDFPYTCNACTTCKIAL